MCHLMCDLVLRTFHVIWIDHLFTEDRHRLILERRAKISIYDQSAIHIKRIGSEEIAKVHKHVTLAFKGLAPLFWQVNRVIITNWNSILRMGGFQIELINI